MQVKYDQEADAMYIRLTDNPVLTSKQLSPGFAVDLDENGNVIGIEVLNVRQSGIDPLAVEVIHTLPDQSTERPDQDTVKHGRAARMEALKRQRQGQTQKA